MVLVPELGGLALALFCLALALAALLIVNAIKNSISSVPGAGKVFGAILNPLVHVLAWAATQLEAGVDAILGATLATFAKVMEWTFDFYKAQAVALLQLAHLVGGQLYHVTGLRAAVDRLVKEWHGIEHGIRSLTREWHGLKRRVKKLERDLSHGIGHDLRIHIKALEKWEKAAKSQLAADERAITQTLPGELAQLENFIKAIPGTRYLDWAAGIVAAGLGASLWNFFRCPTFLSKTLGRGCGFWNGLEDIFSLFLDAVIFVDLCKVLPEAVTLFGLVEAPLTDLISGAANAACAQPPADWVVPMVSTGPLPPPQTLGDTLAA